jgi:hypothetical protein
MERIVADFSPIENLITKFFRDHKIAKILKHCKIHKESGLSALSLFSLVFSLVFTGKNFFRYMESVQADAGIGKDAVYRWMNSVHTNWRKFLLLFSGMLIRKEIVPLDSTKNPKVIVIDDSPYNRNRSKEVELLARVFDHSKNIFFRGFRMLTLCWSDGNTILPFSFSLLSSSDQKNTLVPMNENIDKRSVGYRRRKESIQKAPQVLLDLLAQAIRQGIKADYVIFDSWFSFPATIIAITKFKLGVVCMLKSMPNIYYSYQGRAMTLNQLYKAVRKKRGKAKFLASVIVTLSTKNSSIPVKVLFVRDRRSKKWLALLSTNTALPDEDIVKLYKRRWDIEVFFKMTKSYLNLAKEFQSRSYDALVAHVTIVFCRYIMLATQQRLNKDPRALGSLFYARCDAMRQISFIEAFKLLLQILEDALKEIAGLAEEQIQAMLEKFILELPAFLKHCLIIRVQNETTKPLVVTI